MKRFVYAPKVEAWVKTSEGIVELTPYIVSGSVNRKVNQISTASLVIRNPDFRWTHRKTKQRDGVEEVRPMFHPMDPITITLTRIKDRPVQVFTGYLDQTPYMQLYPGTCTLQASCTLKRLLHTYFDPALPYTLQFMSKYGWYPTGAGQIISTQGNRPTSDGVQSDATIGKLLEATLIEIGGWEPENIHIGRIPPDLAKKVTAIANRNLSEGEKVAEAIDDLLRDIIGVGIYGSGGVVGGGTTVTPGATGGATLGSLTPNQKVFVETLADLAGFDKCVVSAWVFKEMNGSAAQDRENSHNYNWLNIGYFDTGPNTNITQSPVFQDPKTAAQATFEFMQGKRWGASQGIRNILKASGKSANEQLQAICASGWATAGDYCASITSLYKSCQRNAPKSSTSRSSAPSAPTPSGGLNGDNKSRGTIAYAASRNGANSSGGGGSTSCGYPLAKQATPCSSPEDHVAGGRAGEGQPWENKGWDLCVPVGTKALATCSGKITKVYLGTGRLTAGWQIHLQCDNGNNYFYNLHGGSTVSVSAGQRVKCGEVLGTTGNTGVPHLHFSAENNQYPMLNLPPGSGSGASSGSSGGISGGSSGGGGGGVGGIGEKIPRGEVRREAKAAAFAALLEFPSLAEQAEAILLTGKRSLLNDKPLLPFIQELTNASLRNFMSLPNGDFFAFYPDYFGGLGRTPYWVIDDVEIIEGKIELSDDALATHVFVVGDTSAPLAGLGGDGIDWIDRVQTSGVVSLNDAFGSDFINFGRKYKTTYGHKLNPDDPGVLPDNILDFNDEKDVIEFLKRYGARPKEIDQQMIRNRYYELFAAYQTFCLMWSQQFLTDFEFTFMPELFPGGLVGFPDHGIQCYVDEVTHTFDYTVGFSTQAKLMAPAALPTSQALNVNIGLVNRGALNGQ